MTNIAPIFWWKGENNALESQNGVDAGWLITPAYEAGQVGQCFKTITVGSTGEQYSLQILNNSLFDFKPSDSFSIRFWAKINSKTCTDAVLICMGNWSISNNCNWSIQLDDGGYLCVVARGGYYPGLPVNDPITDGNYHDILMTYNDATWQFFVDGRDVGAIATLFNGTHISNNRGLNLNIMGTWYGGTFDGAIDEIRIYDQVIDFDNDDVVIPVVADFESDKAQGRPPLTVQFTDESTGSPTSWDWDYGDGTTHGTTQNPSHIYTTIGKFTVTLIATNSISSSTDTKIQTSYIVTKAIVYRYGSDEYYFGDIASPNYPNQSGLVFYSELFNNPEYGLMNRDLPSTDMSWEISGIQKTERDLIWTLWQTTFQRGNYLFTICDNKKRFLFDVLWAQWKEKWNKQRGGIYSIVMDMISAYSWTPPMFAFYPFTSVNASGYGCHSLDTSSTLTAGSGGSIASRVLILTQQAGATNAASNTALSWKQQKDNSSISFIAQFRSGQLVAGAQVDIVNLTDGSNKLRMYIKVDDESSSQGLSSSSSQGSSSSSVGLSSSSAGLSSSQGLSSSSSVGLSSSSIGLSSSSVGLSSSQGLSSSSSQGLSSSSSAGLSSSSENSSSSVGLSSSSSVGLSSSSIGLSSSSGGKSSSSVGLSSSSSAGLSSSSLNLSSSSVGLSSSQGLSSSSSSEGAVDESSASTSSNSSSSASASNSSSSQSVSESSSGEGTAQMELVFEWTKSGSAAEEISQTAINIESNGTRAWYDICGTFDNINNQFHFYICRSGDSAKAWSYTMNFLQGTTSLLGTPENSITSDLTPTNYPEDVTWTQLYLLKGNQASIYADIAEKAELKFAMIVDEFIPPTEFNWIRRLFHYWNKTGGDMPK